MNQSESIKELAAALAKFQGEISNPGNSTTVTVKTKTGGQYNYKYAPLDEILNLVRPILSKNSLSVVQAPSGSGNDIIITTILLHSSGEWIEFPQLSLKADNATPQAAGSAITYGRRYALSAVLGIASEDDDDGSGKGLETTGEDKPGTTQTTNTSSNQSPTTQKLLSDKQVERLFLIGKARDVNEEAIRRSVKKDYNKDIVNELTKVEYDELCARLEVLPKKK